MATGKNIFPLLTASTTDAEILSLIKDPVAAIGFALEHLEDFEVHLFLRDWQNGEDLTSWIEAWREDQKAGIEYHASRDQQ
ncbi:hypothetical protein GCM10011385_23790 [Nitratireductor aestuarii]|uniref:Uncharacterized protein n=1 Tax=Nitratireductor aestuarii TaxID=1735103 RepID=A0A916RVM6_9HYPH|nr:hypothetical protein [Nitratireductor aestuarii]GGA69257.1 hypothetical protein GCM10011385_23790 [Nitratireductor aestuarii]